jgi:hypothetical protein
MNLRFLFPAIFALIFFNTNIANAQCYTVDSVIQDIKKENLPATTLTLTGDVLFRFREAFKAKFREPLSEDISALMFVIFPKDDRWFVLVFGESGCMAERPTEVDASVVKELLYGRVADAP